MENSATESSARPGDKPESNAEDSHVQAVLNNPKFKLLVQKKRTLSWSLSALMLIIYIGFILLVAYAPDFLHSSFSGGVITWGIPLGIGVIVAAFVLCAVYSVIANGEHERLTQDVVNDINAHKTGTNHQQGAR
ncbi:DUF485 domain-containing protein [Alkanindiges illinoisensis]|uniref:DUF485 domain-containing protein n=1 Tax=Alkanindiges illinoisensis TaxID=197183 RepID=A0A4Y7XCT9_9GAMM|nr:DUF485 domain-containing protein [Alkanindiges illinoisensis]TEU26830.1 DUF485 domain-containing protein [Alkanindiges illinoisensis]